MNRYDYFKKLAKGNWGIDLGKGVSESIVSNNRWETEGEPDRREKRKAMIERFNRHFPAFPIEQEEFPGILSTIELPELDNLEKADTFVKTQSEKVQAYLYKALYLNDMRIDKAETIISKDKK